MQDPPPAWGHRQHLPGRRVRVDALAARARRPRAARGRRGQPRHRARAADHGQHRQVPPGEHLPQAGRRQPDRSLGRVCPALVMQPTRDPTTGRGRCPREQLPPRAPPLLVAARARRRRGHGRRGLLQRDDRRLPGDQRRDPLRRDHAGEDEAVPDHQARHRAHVPEHPPLQGHDGRGERDGRRRRPQPGGTAQRAVPDPAAPAYRGCRPRGGARAAGVRRRGSAARRRARREPLVRRPAQARDRPGDGHAPRSCCASTSRPPGSTPRRSSGSSSSSARCASKASRCCSSSTTCDW